MRVGEVVGGGRARRWPGRRVPAGAHQRRAGRAGGRARRAGRGGRGCAHQMRVRAVALASRNMSVRSDDMMPAWPGGRAGGVKDPGPGPGTRVGGRAGFQAVSPLAIFNQLLNPIVHAFFTATSGPLCAAMCMPCCTKGPFRKQMFGHAQPTCACQHVCMPVLCAPVLAPAPAHAPACVSDVMMPAWPQGGGGGPSRWCEGPRARTRHSRCPALKMPASHACLSI